jgi:hypothetical protein
VPNDLTTGRLADLVLDTKYLDVMRVSCQARLTEEFGLRGKMELTSYMDYISRGMVLRLDAFLAGENLNQIKYPTDWLESVKERWAPKWLLKKYPVKYTTYNITAYYPQMAIPGGGRIAFHTVRMS